MFDFLQAQQPYSRLDGENESHYRPCEQCCRKQRTSIWSTLALGMIILLVCVASFFGGYKLAVAKSSEVSFKDVIPSVPMTGYNNRQQVVESPGIQAAAPADGSREPAWDQLIPNGLGYVKHPSLAPDISVVGAFHQLHCLYTVRRAYYAAYAKSVGQEFNMTGVREPDHIAHCFDYLQQGITCAADSGIEPFFGSHFSDIKFGRRCRDYSRLKQFAEEWRVFDGQGFIFDTTLHSQSSLS